MYHATCQDASNTISRDMDWILSGTFTPVDNKAKGKRSESGRFFNLETVS
jgi:hypothetical protein